MTDILSLLDIVKLILTFVFLAKINPTRCFFSESKLKRTPSAYKTVGRKFFFFQFHEGKMIGEKKLFLLDIVKEKSIIVFGLCL